MGYFFGEEVRKFITKNQIKELDFVASHGQTIFHQPESRMTLQIGHGAALKSKIDFSVICDFRTQDVILGGQGAPLVPIGDELLFSQYDACLNLGGFSNISFRRNNQRIAFDISPVNIILDALAKKLGSDFDLNGEFAKEGNLDENLLNQLNNLTFYKQDHPKSLGFEWLETHFIPIIENNQNSINNKLHTICQHIAQQINQIFEQFDIENVLITGGGAKNLYLIETLKSITKTSIILPNTQLIDYKEALIFAYLGYLKSQSKNNILSSVTGALRDHSSGVIYQ